MARNSTQHGLLRLLLAGAVALSHLGVQPGGYHPGVAAVAIFYLLAGMVAGKLLALPIYSRPWDYWCNRWQRIGPLYLLSLAVAALLWTRGANSIFLSRTPGFGDWLANLAIIPLSFYMYTGQDGFTLIPPAWSLGVELQFYLLAPFILPRRRLLQLCLWASFLIFGLAVLGILPADDFSYRLLPGVLFIFLAGVLLPRARLGDSGARRNLLLLWLATLVLAGFVLLSHRRLAFSYEVLAGLLGAPLLLFFSSPLPSELDRFCGSLSYGLFLFHFPARWLVEIHTGRPAAPVLALVLALLLATVGHLLVERRW